MLFAGEAVFESEKVSRKGIMRNEEITVAIVDNDFEDDNEEEKELVVTFTTFLNVHFYNLAFYS